MKKRSSRLLIALMASAALAFSGVGVASAKNGADDPAGHVSGGHGVDDTATGQSSAGAGHHHGKHHRHGRGHGRHGANDGPNHT